LPKEYHVQVEKGLLGTFGRVMPVLMTLCVVLSIAYAVHRWQPAETAHYLRCAAAVSFLVALASTLVFKVPINAATGKWSADHHPPDWKQTRNRSEFFQAVRSAVLFSERVGVLIRRMFSVGLLPIGRVMRPKWQNGCRPVHQGYAPCVLFIPRGVGGGHVLSL
jgi:hypothetical protein